MSLRTAVGAIGNLLDERAAGLPPHRDVDARASDGSCGGCGRRRATVC